MNSESVSGETSLVSCAGENIPPERLFRLVKSWRGFYRRIKTPCLFCICWNQACKLDVVFDRGMSCCTGVQRLHLYLPSAFCFAACLQPRPHRGKLENRTSSSSPSWSRRPAYIFNLLSFTYCLNDSCNFNESLCKRHGNHNPTAENCVCCAGYQPDACCQLYFT